jgi:hypothetical protein
MAGSRKIELFLAASSSSGAEAAVGSDDRRWKALTTRANAAFAAERKHEAENLYLDALAEADAVFRTWCEGQPAKNADPAPMLVVATANLVECWLAGGQPGRAGDHLVALRCRLCAMIESGEARPDIREQCFRQLRPLVAEFVDKLSRAGWRQEQIEREVEQIRAVALRYLARDTTKH